jgi:PAS domain S-box-containing protein
MTSDTTHHPIDSSDQPAAVVGIPEWTPPGLERQLQAQRRQIVRLLSVALVIFSVLGWASFLAYGTRQPVGAFVVVAGHMGLLTLAGLAALYLCRKDCVRAAAYTLALFLSTQGSVDLALTANLQGIPTILFCIAISIAALVVEGNRWRLPASVWGVCIITGTVLHYVPPVQQLEVPRVLVMPWTVASAALLALPLGITWFLNIKLTASQAEVERRASIAARMGRQLRQFLEGAPDAIAVANTAGRIMLVNTQTEALFGYPREELLGQPVAILVPEPSGAARVNLAGSKAREDRFDLYARHKDGHAFPVEVMLSPIESEEGVVIARAIRDITARKETERELAAARDQALETTRLKSEFLANMSHEIRTPMNGIFGMTELLLDTALSSEQRELAATLHRCAGGLLNVLNDVLDFSKIEARQLQLETASFRLREHVDDTLRELVPAASKKGLTLAVDVLPEVPDALTGDPHRLRQVVVNLIGNAIKFTERGAVIGRVSVESQTEGGVALHVSVADTGIGIPAEKHQAIFDAFAQGDGSMTRRYGGTGLGLAISSRLVDMMGGRIWLESEVGQGSTFHFTARFGLSQEARLSRSRPPAGSGVSHTPARILVAEDDPVNRMVTVRLLEYHGHTVATAEDGRQVLALLEQERFDLILMDLQMPEMDGLEAVGAIRAHERTTGTRLPIVALTAHAMTGDRERCLEAGMDAYVAKPVRGADLVAAVDEVLAQPGVEKAACRSKPPATHALDTESLLRRVGEDPGLLLDLVKAFQVDSRRLLDEVRSGLSRCEPGLVERAAHRLKGSLGTLGASAAYEAAARLEAFGRAGDLDPAEQALFTLERELARLEPELTALTTIAPSRDS